MAKAEDKAAKEHAARKKQEARVAEVRQELHALMEKHEGLERDSKTRESELASALEIAKAAKAEAYKALQEIQEAWKIVAGKAFNMQSKHVKVITCYLPESGALQEHSQICPTVCPPSPHSTEPKRGPRWRGVLVPVC